MEIKEELQLNHLSEDLSLLGVFVITAYHWAMKHPHYKTDVWDSLTKVNGLCQHTQMTLKNFEVNSKKAVNTLQRAYHYLKDDLEIQAFGLLNELKAICNEMKEEIKKIISECSEKSRFIQEVRQNVLCNMCCNKEIELKEHNHQSIGDIESVQRENEKNYLKQVKDNDKIALRELDEIVQQLKQCNEGKCDILAATAQSLNGALYLLSNIQLIMKNVESFWEGVERVRKSTDHNMISQIEILTNENPQQLKNIWKTDAFKVDALMFYVERIALQEACATAEKGVRSTLNRIQRYILQPLEYNNKEVVLKIIDETRGEFFPEKEDIA